MLVLEDRPGLIVTADIRSSHMRSSHREVAPPSLTSEVKALLGGRHWPKISWVALQVKEIGPY